MYFNTFVLLVDELLKHVSMIDKSKLKLKIKNEQIKPRYLMTISGSFDEELYDKTLGLLAPYIAEKDKYSGITIYITSLGGGAHIGLALYDLFKSFNTSIYTVALGECTSAATLVFSLGEKRFVGENTICLLHSVSMGNEGYSNARDITELYSRMKVYNSKILECFCINPIKKEAFCFIVKRFYFFFCIYVSIMNDKVFTIYRNSTQFLYYRLTE